MTEETFKNAQHILWRINELKHDVVRDRENAKQSINHNYSLSDAAKSNICDLIDRDCNVDFKLAELQKEFDAL